MAGYYCCAPPPCVPMVNTSPAQPQEKKRVRDPTGERMKEYERSLQTYVDGSKPYIVRLDGHGFSKFTKQFRKPFDDRMARAMISTATDLLTEFSALTAYTQSDEITLVFGPVDPEIPGQTVAYNGKVQKMVSLMAGFCSARFNHHIGQEEWDAEVDGAGAAKATGAAAYFDARVFNVPSKEEAVNNVLWRSVYDCRKNSVSMLAQSNFSHGKLQGVPTRKLLDMLDEKGVSWDAMPGPFKYGTFIKKYLVRIQATDRKTGEPVEAVRTRIRSESLDMEGFRPEHVDFLFGKYWSPDPVAEEAEETR